MNCSKSAQESSSATRDRREGQTGPRKWLILWPPAWKGTCKLPGMIEHGTLPCTSSCMYAPDNTEDGRIRIALADDHPVFRDGLCEILQLEEDFHLVGRASGGDEILDIVEKQRPEILLLDLFMPGRDGLDTLRLVRERYRSTKVIVLTASEDREHLVRAMQLGASGIVLKHDSTAVLIKSIRRVHAGEIWLHSSTTEAVMERSAPAPAPTETGYPPEPEPDPLLSALTRKETEVVRMIAQGLRNREIASRMFISEQTVKNHLRAIFEKLQVSDRLELALFAVHHIIRE
jgi:DNA-binding NarL/FixJ family response regulator